MNEHPGERVLSVEARISWPDYLRTYFDQVKIRLLVGVGVLLLFAYSAVRVLNTVHQTDAIFAWTPLILGICRKAKAALLSYVGVDVFYNSWLTGGCARIPLDQWNNAKNSLLPNSSQKFCK